MIKKMKEIIGRIMYKSRYVWSWDHPGQTMLYRLWYWVRKDYMCPSGKYYENDRYQICRYKTDRDYEYAGEVIATGSNHDDLMRVYHMYFDTQNTTVAWRKDAEPVRCDGGNPGA